MNELNDMLAIAGHPLLALGLLALAVGLLEAERLWTRMRRRHGRRVGSPASILDALAIASAALAVISALALLARGVIGAIVFGGLALSWAVAQARTHAGLLAAIVVGMAIVAAGVALVRRRLSQARQSPRLPELAEIEPPAADPGGAQVVSAAPAMPQTPPAPSPKAPAAGIPLMPPIAVAQQPAHATAFPAAQSMVAQAEEPVETLASFSMIGRTRHQAAPPPPSFLPSAPEPAKRRSRLPLALALLALAALAGGAFAFRQQLGGQLATQQLPISSAIPTAASSRPAAQEPAAPAVPAAPTAPPLATRHVKSDALNLRTRPGTDQPVISTLAHGASVTLLNETTTIGGRVWVRVRVGEQEGWVSQDLLE